MYINVLYALFPAINIIMAKAASLFNGTTAGKVGEVVFFRANGQQRARQYVPTVNDAKTESQVTQRVMLSPCIIAYRLLKSVLADSFPNSSIGISGYNAFVGANKTTNNAYYTKDNVALGQFSMAPYNVSKGILTPLEVGEYEALSFKISIPGGAGTGFPAFKTEYMAAYPDALASDRLTYMRIYSELLDGISPSVKILSFSLSDNAFPAAITYTGGYLVVTLPLSSAMAEFTIAMVRSQRDANGKVNVSSQKLIQNTMAETAYTKFSGAQQLQSALNSYGYNAAKVI